MQPAPRLLSYYGSKYRIAPHYPKPDSENIIEPFAGGAGYSLHHYKKNVYLYDLNPKVVGVWEYIIKAKPQEILQLPILDPEQSVDDLSVHQEAKWLIGWWIACVRPTPATRFTSRMKNIFADDDARTWTPKRREMIAQTSMCVKHWKIELNSYENIKNQHATWFIDPPYQCKAGRTYTFNTIDFNHLAEWSKNRQGQVIVCENSNSEKWLPFEPFMECSGSAFVNGVNKRTEEVVWYNTPQEVRDDQLSFNFL